MFVWSPVRVGAEIVSFVASVYGGDGGSGVVGAVCQRTSIAGGSRQASDGVGDRPPDAAGGGGAVVGDLSGVASGQAGAGGHAVGAHVRRATGATVRGPRHALADDLPDGGLAGDRNQRGSGARLLEKLQGAFPFRVESIQADGGGEFRGAFEQACQAAGVRLVILPPRSPRLNGQVESLNNAIQRECLNPWPAPAGVEELQGQAGDWAWRYNHRRPPAALGYRKPVEFVEEPKPA